MHDGAWLVLTERGTFDAPGGVVSGRNGWLSESSPEKLLTTREFVKTEKNSIFLKKGKMVIAAVVQVEKPGFVLDLG